MASASVRGRAPAQTLRSVRRSAAGLVERVVEADRQMDVQQGCSEVLLDEQPVVAGSRVEVPQRLRVEAAVDRTGDISPGAVRRLFLEVQVDVRRIVVRSLDEHRCVVEAGLDVELIRCPRNGRRSCSASAAGASVVTSAWIVGCAVPAVVAVVFENLYAWTPRPYVTAIRLSGSP